MNFNIKVDAEVFKQLLRKENAKRPAGLIPGHVYDYIESKLLDTMQDASYTNSIDLCTLFEDILSLGDWRDTNEIRVAYSECADLSDDRILAWFKQQGYPVFPDINTVLFSTGVHDVDARIMSERGGHSWVI